MALSRAANPSVPCLLATVVIDPSFESTVASSLVAQLVDFAAACRLDYATSLVAESESDCPPSIGGECGDSDAPDIPTPRSYAEAITGPYSSQWQTVMDAEMASWKSTGTYVNAVPPSKANIVDGMWTFRVKRPPGSPPAFKARYIARGFSQRQGVDFFHTFSPTPKITTLRGNLHKEIWLRCPPGFTGTDTSLPPIYVLVYANDLVLATADTKALALVKSELQKRHTCTDLGPSALRLPVLLVTVHSTTYRSLALISTFGRVRRTEWSVSSLDTLTLLGSSCEAEFYAGAMAAQELH
ncbi:unnamed protein product [Closterium sp. NIES-53]